ncbi:MAG: hypothetical protein BMS9Abin25_0680 [Gammaproteobacteria bacterium]|nr:MAG: hypothetical protein BMS9Abin25_0680 [Gammaproteobacteria bacterium]
MAEFCVRFTLHKIQPLKNTPVITVVEAVEKPVDNFYRDIFATESVLKYK